MSSTAKSLDLKDIPIKVIPAPQADAVQSPGVKRIERFFVRHREKLMWLHIVMFLFFVALLFGPLFLSEPSEQDTAWTHLTPLANYVMWGLWFPLVFLSVLFTGRSWCGLLCPMGAASEWANKVGFQRAIPRWVRWQGTPIVSFLIITILGQTVGVRDHPEAIALIFGGVLVAAVALGFFYGRNKRAWCRHMCPIGLLLGVFSRLGAVQFWPKRKKSGGETYTELGMCPTMIDINRKQASRHCIECFRCVFPDSKGGLALRLRRPGQEVEQIRTHRPNTAEVWFLFLGSGAALGGFLWLVLPIYKVWRQRAGEWLIDHGMYWIGEAGPWWLMSVHPERREVFNWLDFFMIVGFMTTCIVMLAAMLAFTTWLAAWIAGRYGADLNLRRRFVELGYQYAPVAMVSLVVGLGGQLFEVFHVIGINDVGIGYIKGILFLMGLLWSMHLGNRILANQGVSAGSRWLPLTPGLIGSVLVALAWWPAIFGI